MFIILTLIVLVAALNIISGLIMLVKDKSSDIAILRTMGATRGAIMRVFLITGASIGVVGTLAGFVLGLVCSALNVESHPANSSPAADSTRQLCFPTSSISCQPAAGRHEPDRGRDRRRRWRWSCRCSRRSIRPGGRRARSGRGAALRMTRRWTPAIRHRRCICRRSSAATAKETGFLEVLRGAELAIWPGEMVALVAPVRHRQVDPAACRGPAREARRRRGLRRRRADRRHGRYRAHPPAPRGARLRLPVPPPAAGVLGARERGDAAAHPRARARPRRGTRASQLLTFLGLGERLEHRPAELLRRRAAARRHRPRGRQRAAPAAGRRADRQPRPAAPPARCSRPWSPSCAPRASPP